MRVLIYGFTGGVIGGIENFILNMSEHMSTECVFDYILEGNECIYKNRIENKGGKIFYVPWLRLHPIRYIIQFWNILREQKKQGTCLFYYQLASMTKLLPAIMAKVNGYRVVLHAHNNGLQNSRWIYRQVHKFGKIVARFFNFEHYTNSLLSSDFMFGKGVNAELIYNAIDTDLFSFSEKEREDVRKELNCDNKIVVGFVGRFSPQKNPIFMLRIFACFFKYNPNSELWIVGDGNLKNDMENEVDSLGIGQHVKWLGLREDIYRLMQGMDLLLQPSLFEGLGIVLIEGQAAGLPVVSSKEVIPDEAIVTDYIKLFPLSETPSYWAKEMLLFYNNEKNKNRKSCHIPDNFNIIHEAKRLEDLLVK